MKHIYSTGIIYDRQNIFIIQATGVFLTSSHFHPSLIFEARLTVTHGRQLKGVNSKSSLVASAPRVEVAGSDIHTAVFITTVKSFRV